MKNLKLPAIPPDAHKYSRGSLLILGGSISFPGAAILAACSGALTGAGYVTLAIPASVVPIAQAHLLSIPVVGGKETNGVFAADALLGILQRINHIDAVVIGPGLTTTSSTMEFVRAVQAWATETHIPLLLDADALNAIATNVGVLDANTVAPNLPKSTRQIFTPHAGELARLFASTATATAKELACQQKAVVVAKGPSTLITDGIRVATCNEGTPALAKAGTGDVLSGIIGSLLAQGMEAFEAAEAGVVIHARAGRHAENTYGTRSVMAEHLLEVLPAVLREVLA